MRGGEGRTEVGEGGGGGMRRSPARSGVVRDRVPLVPSVE